jgi:hypothetical protein
MAADREDYQDDEDIKDAELVEDEEDEHQDDEGEDQDDNEHESASSEGADDSDEDREAIRARRREERKHKKEAQREREAQTRREREMLRKENEDLQQRLAVLERRAQGSEFAQLDQAIEQTGRAVGYLKEQIKLATEAGDGATVAEATEKLYQATRHAEHLVNVKRNAVQQTRQAETHSPIDPMLRRNAETWMDKHNWYDPSGSDPDSRVALTVDQSMAEEGWDPRQPEYWDELDSRLKRYLPHRYARPPVQRRSSSPVTSSGREGANSQSGGGGFKLSADRVAAIKEAGAWDDPVKRDAMIKRYREYDKSQASR